ncbi:uncharacterized protein LOC124910576 [Impatiens glandulifera]|uniref:uncharacterized protein LOC124910576 n=1 Tax=Impatiens glandulifera TaxID=253017 RepID=UPI001FB158F0|nr:uncharacterized protein LOC124910576 [Impatiens glandulifera]
MLSLEIRNPEEASPNPLIPANRYVPSDEVAPSVLSQDLQRQKRKKWAIYIALFALFQVTIILVFALVVMKARTPLFMVRSATFTSSNYNRSGINPSFDFNMSVDFRIKNANFGSYKYEEFNVYFYYEDSLVVTAPIYKSRTGFLSTRKFPISINLSSNELSGLSLSTLAIDLSTGVLPLTINSTMKGKVEILLLFKKKKSTSMKCNMGINTLTGQLQDIKCMYTS